MKWKSVYKSSLPFLVCFLFFFLYLTLAVIRHSHFESFGFDLGITDQILWQYSTFSAPITTIHYYPFTSILTDHVELIYAPLSIFYWLWSDPKMLLLVQAGFFCFSGMPIFLLAKSKRLNTFIAYVLLISYLTFYGVQNALWFDVHSAVFGASFLAWFLYFRGKNHTFWSAVFFILAIISKENIALLTLIISAVFFIKRRKKSDAFFVLLAGLYLLTIFAVYFPHFTKGYAYQNSQGLASNINFTNLANTPNKQQVFLVSLAWFGFIPLLAPLTLLPFLGDLFSYFVIANQLKEADSIFMHYRITLAPLLAWGTIIAISERKFLQKCYIGVYLLLTLLFFQFTLHLPLSYLTKSWFWKEPAAVKDINDVLQYLPANASVVSQNNITPHISHRKEIFTLWPKKKNFTENSPCGKKTCDWFGWYGHPTYLIVDTSPNWDIRHLLANKEDYIEGLKNIEKQGIIKKTRQQGNTVLYKIVKTP
jgi:uncharacterized membrane protein